MQTTSVPGGLDTRTSMGRANSELSCQPTPLGPCFPILICVHSSLKYDVHAPIQKVSIMLYFIQTMSLSAILASGTLLCGQNAMACGRGQPCAVQTSCAASCCVAAAPAATVTPGQPQVDHTAHAQTGARTRYQSAFQNPVAQPHYYAPVQQRRAPAWSEMQNNYLPKADPRRFSRGN